MFAFLGIYGTVLIGICHTVLYRTPRLAKIILGLAVGYALSPIDLIPDFIPIIGHLDDFIIVPALVFIAMKMVPETVRRDYCLR